MRITLQDIADKYGVSKMTVSMALRNHPRISSERCQQIQELAKQMGYVADPFLSGLLTYRHEQNAAKLQGRLAWINHWPTPEKLRSYREFEIYFQSAAAAAKRLGYKLLEIVWPADVPPRKIEEELSKNGVLGLLIPPHPQGIDWGDFDWSQFSLMRFGLSVVRPDSNLVTADLQRAMIMAVQKIHEHGYRRIGLIYNRAHDQSIGGNYYGGFLAGHRLLGVKDIIPPLDSETRTTVLAERSKRNLALWMKQHRPDAILATAAEAPVFLRELGYQIPRDVAVASTNPNDISVDTGIDQHPRAIGRIAVEMLIKQISLNERGVPADPCRILVESRWREGNSLPNKPVHTAE